MDEQTTLAPKEPGCLEILKNRLRMDRAIISMINERGEKQPTDCIFFSTHCSSVNELERGEYGEWPRHPRMPIILSDKATILDMEKGVPVPIFLNGAIVEVHLLDKSMEEHFRNNLQCDSCGTKHGLQPCKNCGGVYLCRACEGKTKEHDNVCKTMASSKIITVRSNREDPTPDLSSTGLDQETAAKSD